MKKFILQISIFLAILFVIALPIDYMISMGLRRVHNLDFAVWNDIYNNENMQNDLVVLGASSAWTSYNTYMLDSILNLSSYNLGVDGHPWYMYKIRYDAYKKVACKPKFIVINLDKATFLESLEEPYMREQFLPYPGLMWKVCLDKKFSLADLCFPYVRYIGYSELTKMGVEVYWGGKTNNESNFYKGYFGQKKQWNMHIDATDITSTPSFACSKKVKEDMVDFIKRCQSENIDVILCRYPIYKPYLEKCSNLDNFEQLCNQISSETGAPMFDFSKIYIVSDTSYFYNPTHLNEDGAIIFTKDFCSRFTYNYIQ